MLKLYLLRHAETEFSRQDRFCGHIDAPLTGFGEQMATCFAATYGRLPWRAIYTSTRARTIGTAEPLATRAALLVRRAPALDEIDYGAWQGRTKTEIAATEPERYQRWLTDPTVGAPGGESVRDVQARATALVAEIRGEYDDGNVLLVSHKTTLRVLLCSLLGMDLSRYRDCVAQPVCGVSVIELRPRGAMLHALGDVGHLPPSLRARALGEAASVPAAVEAPHADAAVAAQGEQPGA